MVNSPGQSPLVIERILRDRAGVWQQINDERGLRALTVRMLAASVVSLALFGLVLGSSNGFWQALSSMVKLPLLFLATLAICLPTLYLFNLIFGARLSMPQTVTLIMVPITVTAALTLAFAPISLFFLITAQSYAFFKLLNVGILVLTAFVGLRFLTAGMAALNAHQQPAAGVADPPADPPAGLPAGPAADPPNGAPQSPASLESLESLDEPPFETLAELPERQPALVTAGGGSSRNDGHAAVPAVASHPAPVVARPVSAPATAPALAAAPGPAPAAAPAPAAPATALDQRPTSMALVRIWILLFGFVGTQLAWTLRPFFGDPDAPFALFREVNGTFYSDILHTIGRLVS